RFSRERSAVEAEGYRYSEETCRVRNGRERDWARWLSSSDRWAASRVCHQWRPVSVSEEKYRPSLRSRFGQQYRQGDRNPDKDAGCAGQDRQDSFLYTTEVVTSVP